ncbi:STAS domain-containing protein [Sphaerisporangium perillae]|uniref:STAS domain-containing protein n=1 Tax=Sphaerisporangium perillae TaxID=2935860 RepID=UPI00200C1C0C|nr:STAS domain-containing protein [Sphaerisporangium perillae]
MDLSIKVRADSTLCRVSGDIDISCSPQLRERLIALLQLPQARLLLDLSGVTFMDASGLGALMAARRRSVLLGGDLRIVAASSSVHRVLEASGLRRLFPVVPDTTAPAATCASAAKAVRRVVQPASR